MTNNEKLVILSTMLDYHKNCEEYLKSLPRDISNYLTGNIYNTGLEQTKDLFIRNVFPEMAEDIYWFMYELPKDGGRVVMESGVEYFITDKESFMNYLYAEFGEKQ